MKNNVIKVIAGLTLSLILAIGNPLYVNTVCAESTTTLNHIEASVGAKLANGNYYTSSVDKIDKNDSNYAQCDNAKISGNKLTIHASFGKFDDDSKKISVKTRKLTLKKGCEIRAYEDEGDTGRAISKKQFNKWFKKGTKNRLYCTIQVNVKNGKVTGIYMGP